MLAVSDWWLLYLADQLLSSVAPANYNKLWAQSAQKVLQQIVLEYLCWCVAKHEPKLTEKWMTMTGGQLTHWD